jgi:hypothetical protein
LRQEWSLDIVPACVDRGPYRCRPPCGRDLVVLATYSSKPNILDIPLCEKTTVHRAWEMVRVACTHPVDPPGVAQEGGVLCSQVAQTGSRFGEVK